MSLNTITIMGRLTRDVDLRNTTNGTSVADFCLAVDRDRKNSNGDREADFIDCVAWGKTAEFADRNLSKGQKVVVCGRLQVDRWIDQEGKNRRNYKVSVQTIYFADAGRKSIILPMPRKRLLAHLVTPRWIITAPMRLVMTPSVTRTLMTDRFRSDFGGVNNDSAN